MFLPGEPQLCPGVQLNQEQELELGQATEGPLKLVPLEHMVENMNPLELLVSFPLFIVSFPLARSSLTDLPASELEKIMSALDDVTGYWYWILVD